MSLVGGLVDKHHEMELSPSTQLVKSTWYDRHLGVLLLVGAAIILYFAL